MKITRRQLRDLIAESAHDDEFMKGYDRQRRIRREQEFAQDPAWDSDADTNDPDNVDSQDMADAKRYAGHKGPEGMAKYLGISVDDWYKIRQELDDHYEDRHMEDQMAFDDDPDLDDDGTLSVGELVKMTQNIADDIKEDKMKITREQLKSIILNEFNVAEGASSPDMIGINPRWETPASRDFPGALENIAADIQDMIDNAVGQVDLEYSDDPLTKRDILDFVIRMLTEEFSILPGR